MTSSRGATPAGAFSSTVFTAIYMSSLLSFPKATLNTSPRYGNDVTKGMCASFTKVVACIIRWLLDGVKPDYDIVNAINASGSGGVAGLSG